MPSARKRRPAQHLALIGILLFLSGPSDALAQGRGNILRIDPRASQTEDAPVLTTVLEIVQLKSTTEVIGACRALDVEAQKDGRAYDCIADAVEKPKAMWDPISFPEDKTFMTIKVENVDKQMKLVSKVKWADAAKDKAAGVGTAWLVLIDSSGSMSSRFDEAKLVAKAFVSSKRDGDVFDVMFFNDLGVVVQSKWTGDKEKVLSFIDETAKPFKVDQGGVREIGNIIKNAAIDGFRELGNLGQTVKAPMHQAMVVLSSGDGGSASSAVSQFATVLSNYMTDGRFEEKNLALPKMPVPVISVWFPAKITGAAMGVGKEERFDQSRAFMESLANPQIGGLFTIVRDGGGGRGERIVGAVRSRFDAMWLVKWQVSCVAPTVQQTFNLLFDKGLNLAGDGSYQDVPVGIDPSAWPLDIDMDRTVAEADKNPLVPGGKVTIFGNFCWEGKKERAELYLLPKNQEVPTTLDGATIEDAKNAKNTLIEQGLKGIAIDATDDSVVFELPDKEKFLSGKGEDLTARLVLHDNSSKRSSAVTKDKIITLRAKPKPPPYLMIGAIAGGGVVLILLLVAAFRGGGKRRGGGGVNIAPPPRPVVGNPGPPAMGGGMAMGPAPLPGPPPPPGPPPAPPPPGPSFVQRATLTGAAGIFTVMPGVEMKAGRDGAMCQILLAEPRVSGCHATMKIDSGQLYVRDDNSNNGTTLNGQRLPAGVWTPIPNGGSLRFGPIEFSVALE